MSAQIESSEQTLRKFLVAEECGCPAIVERDEVVAHALLSGLVHHWPSRATPQIIDLLERSIRIKTSERSRWAVQRRIAIAKLAKIL